MRALITGATGFVGRRLCERLENPRVLTRSASRARQELPGAEIAECDLIAGPAPEDVFRDIDVVIHLAGEPVAEGRWNAAKKQRIRDSRVVGTRNLVAGMRRAAHQPTVLVSASAVGWYGSRGEEVLDESAPAADDFLGQVCVAWEREAALAAEFGVRVVSARIGVVLGHGGGALAKMLTPFRFGLGGRLGSGRQWMPWIHLDDLVGLLLHAAHTPALSGPMNSVAPNPVTNREFTKTLASVLHRPAIFPVPAPVLRVLVGEFADILFASQRVTPRAALQAGYEFQHPELRGALDNILSAT